jgi:hypothetical protein
MLRSPLGARSEISWCSWSALVVVLLAYYETLEFWIEYAYLSQAKMSWCSIQACCALLIVPECVHTKVAVRCLLIAHHTPILDREFRSVPQVRPCGRTMLKSKLRWSAIWWRGATFWRRRLVDRWVHARGIDHFPIVMPDHVDSSGFVVRIPPRINPGDQVLIAGLTAAENVATEVLRSRGNLKPIVVLLKIAYQLATL